MQVYMLHTNLNITKGELCFKYIVEYNDVDTKDNQTLYWWTLDDDIYLCDTTIFKKLNYWLDDEVKEVEEAILRHDTAPSSRNISKFRIFFPRFSVDTYETNIKYILTINTWVNGHRIFLYTGVLDRADALAPSEGVRTFLNDRYFECIDIECVDPYYLIYGDEWREFRESICGEKHGLNNTGSNIQINLTPVCKNNDKWLKMQEYNEAQSAIMLNTNVSKYLHCDLSTNVTEKTNDAPYFKALIDFNDVYNHNNQGLREYMQETYSLENDVVSTIFSLIIKDKEDAYKFLTHTYDGFIQTDKFFKSELDIKDWSEFKEGLDVCCLVRFTKRDDPEEDILVLSSNSLFFNIDLFRFFVGENYLNHINLEEVNMNNYTIDAINRIEQKVVMLERPEDYKANIQKPVFIRTQDTRMINVHPAVTENVAINLDAYKNKVNMFALKIGDAIFWEMGRVSSGVVFKIVGTKLAEDIENGVYYILDDNQEMVTSGKYTVIK